MTLPSTPPAPDTRASTALLRSRDPNGTSALWFAFPRERHPQGTIGTWEQLSAKVPPSKSDWLGGEPQPNERRRREPVGFHHPPFGDEPMWGAPLPSERPDGRQLLAERLQAINVRGALPLVGVALAFLVVVIIVGALVSA